MPTLTRYRNLQTGTLEPFEFGVYGLGGGLNVRDLPQTLPENQLPILQDMYLTSTGGLQLRNGMTQYGVQFGSQDLVHLARFFQEVRGGATVSPNLVQLIAEVDGYLYNCTPTANALIGNVGHGFQHPMVWARIQNPNDPHFGGGLTDCLVVCTGYGGPYVYDGFNLYTPAGWSDASGALYCAVVNGILWFGGIAAFPNQIFGTGDGITASMESLPGYRNFVFSSPVAGMVASGTGAQAALVVGLNDGLGIVFGTGPSNFYAQETPFADTVTAARTMIAWDGTIFFLGQNAEYAFNMGALPVSVSDPVEPWILNRPTTSIPSYPGFPMTQNRQLSWSLVYNNRLHVGYCSSGPVPDTILVFDLLLQGWTVLRPNPGIASMILLDAPSDPTPYVAMAGGSNGTIYTWDVQPTDTDTVMDGATPVLAQFQTKFYKIGVPGTNKALQRVYPEFFISGEFIANFVMLTDYGSGGVTTPLDIPFSAFFAEWDVSMWDDADWAGGPGQFLAFTSPQNRIDYPGTQAEAFSFGVQMTQALAPWVFGGMSGVLSQRGRT